MVRTWTSVLALTVVGSLSNESDLSDSTDDNSDYLHLLQRHAAHSPSRISNGVGTSGDWSYNAPGRWVEQFPACGGNAQSPIDILVPPATSPLDENGGVGLRFQSQPLQSLARGVQMVNTGRAVQVDGDFGNLTLADGIYSARQLVFHFPSEHRVLGKLADGEMQVVAQREGSSGSDDQAVLSILLDVEPTKVGYVGLEQSFFAELGLGAIPQIGQDQRIQYDIDLDKIFVQRLYGHYWHYRGSLTSPPCTEGVHWYVLQSHAAVTQQMEENFKHVFPDPMNNRPVQVLDNRDVFDSTMKFAGEFD